MVRIEKKWYFQDDRLREYRAIDNPHERISFSDYEGKEMRIEEIADPKKWDKLFKKACKKIAKKLA